MTQTIEKVLAKLGAPTNFLDHVPARISRSVIEYEVSRLASWDPATSGWSQGDALEVLACSLGVEAVPEVAAAIRAGCLKTPVRASSHARSIATTAARPVAENSKPAGEKPRAKDPKVPDPEILARKREIQKEVRAELGITPRKPFSDGSAADVS